MQVTSAMRSTALGYGRGRFVRRVGDTPTITIAPGVFQILVVDFSSVRPIDVMRGVNRVEIRRIVESHVPHSIRKTRVYLILYFSYFLCFFC